MFTGIVEEQGEVVGMSRDSDSAALEIAAARVCEDLRHGASVAVDGVCLTVTGWSSRPDGRTAMRFDVMGETLRRSALAGRRPGDAVNLERAAAIGARIDGHIVQGHVDGTATVAERRPADRWETVRFELAPELARFLAEKGSVAVDGVSLTVTAVGADWFEVGLIPETLRATTLGRRGPGERVNIEVDVLARYVARLLETAK